MKYKLKLFLSPSKIRVLFIPGWQSVLPDAFIEKLKEKFSLCILLFGGSDKSIPLEKALTIEDYKNIYSQIVSDFKPDAIIGHSFGGKIISYFPNNIPTYLIAPSSFPPSYLAKLKIKILIIRNKFIKNFCSFFKLPIKRKYLGSKDYQNSSGLTRQTFLNIKDQYPPLSSLKEFKHLKIFAYDKDKAIPAKRIIRNCKKANLNYQLFKGNHFTFFVENNFLIKEIINDIDNISYSKHNL